MHAAVWNRSFACKLNCSNTQLFFFAGTFFCRASICESFFFQVQDGNSWLKGTKLVSGKLQVKSAQIENFIGQIWTNNLRAARTLKKKTTAAVKGQRVHREQRSPI